MASPTAPHGGSVWRGWNGILLLFTFQREDVRPTLFFIYQAYHNCRSTNVGRSAVLKILWMNTEKKIVTGSSLHQIATLKNVTEPTFCRVFCNPTMGPIQGWKSLQRAVGKMAPCAAWSNTTPRHSPVHNDSSHKVVVIDSEKTRRRRHVERSRRARCSACSSLASIILL